MAPPDAPAGKVGRPSTEECRRLRSLLCGPGDVCSVSVERRSSRARVLLQLHLLLRTSTVVECSCQSLADGLLLVPEHRTQPPLTSTPSCTSWWSPARVSHHCATQRNEVRANLSELMILVDM